MKVSLAKWCPDWQLDPGKRQQVPNVYLTPRLTLSKEDPHSIVLAQSIIGHLALYVAHEYVRASTDGELNETQILSTRRFMKERAAGRVIQIGEIYETNTGRFQ